MWSDSGLLRAISLRCIRECRVPSTWLQNRTVHYQITPSGDKVVVSKRHNIKTKREEWQNVPVMGKEKELRQISMVEQDERLQADPLMAKVTADSKLDQLRNRLQISGFCREAKPYDPPKDVNERIDRISKEIFSASGSFADQTLRFRFLTRCIQEFNHEVPNSDLFRMNTIDDVKEFYQTPVIGKNNYDQMVQNSANLPKNLHVIPEPLRFNPQTDTFFGGVSAFPGPSNELEGLRAKKKYPTFNDNFVWPDV